MITCGKPLALPALTHEVWRILPKRLPGPVYVGLPMRAKPNSCTPEGCVFSTAPHAQGCDVVRRGPTWCDMVRHGATKKGQIQNISQHLWGTEGNESCLVRLLREPPFLTEQIVKASFGYRFGSPHFDHLWMEHPPPYPCSTYGWEKTPLAPLGLSLVT